MATVLQLRDLVVARPGDDFAVVLPALDLGAGEVAALLGPSGCGKTSLLLGALGLLPSPPWQVRGGVAVAGETWSAGRARAVRRQVAVVLQDAHAALDPLTRVGPQIVAATGVPPPAAIAALAELGVDDAGAIAARFPHQLSGGQAQRVLLAVALLRSPPLLIADEPSASLDGGSFDDLLRSLRLLRERTGTAMLLATHDRRLVQALEARCLGLEQGAFRPAEPDARPWPARSVPRSRGGEVVLAARGLRVAYRGRAVLAGVDFSVRRGEVLALVGESGAGKTTLARVLVGHQAPDGGEVKRPPRRAAVQLLFQDAGASLTPGRSLAALLAETAGADFDPAAAAAAVDLPAACLQRSRERLSGGEQRRAALLRALSVRPELLILDEPTASLDCAAAAAVIALLLRVQQERGLAIVLITHDLELAAAVADRVVTLSGGRLCS